MLYDLTQSRSKSFGRTAPVPPTFLRMFPQDEIREKRVAEKQWINKNEQKREKVNVTNKKFNTDKNQRSNEKILKRMTENCWKIINFSTCCLCETAETNTMTWSISMDAIAFE